MTGTRLRVGHVVTLLELGGAQHNTLYTVRELDRTAFDVRLYAGTGAELDRDALEQGLPFEAVPSLVRPIRPSSDVRAFADLKARFLAWRPHIVHTHSSKAGILGRAAARAAGVPIVVHTVHGFGFHAHQPPWTRAAYVALERWAGARTDALIFVSKTNMADAERLGIGRTGTRVLIRSGVALPLFRSLARRPNAPQGLDIRAQERLVTTIGPFKPQKNLVDFVRAAARVRRTADNVKFLIVGDGAQRALLEREIKREDLGACMILAGWRRDIPNILMRTQVFAMTSLWEGLPRSLVEAMASALPCVVNDADGTRDLLRDGENGFLIPPLRPDLTAGRILELLAHPDRAVEIGRRARESVGDDFDIDGMVRRQEALYQELARRSGLKP